MQNQRDPVDGALDTLGGRSWPADYDHNKLKDKIMQDYHTKRSISLMKRRGVLAATLAFVLLGTAGFAVAGGFEMVRGWFITIEVDGDVIDITDAEIDVSDDGDTITITASGLVEDVDEPISISITAEPGAAGSIVVQDTEGNVIKTLDAKVNGESVVENK